MGRDNQEDSYLGRLRALMPEAFFDAHEEARFPPEPDDGLLISDDELDVDDSGCTAFVDGGGRAGNNRPHEAAPLRAIVEDSGVMHRVARVRRFAAGHAKALATLGLIAVIASTWAIMSARTLPMDAQGSQTVSVDVTPAPTSTPSEISWMIHVMGAVRSPGVVEVPKGSRVLDAIEAAGGFTDTANAADLNLAAVLTDGAQVIIGTTTEPKGEVRTGTGGSAIQGNGSSTSAGTTGGTLINLNTATSAQLETLPGVGPVTASSIMAWRNKNGGFTDVIQLQEVDGIGPKTFAQIEPYVCV